MTTQLLFSVKNEILKHLDIASYINNNKVDENETVLVCRKIGRYLLQAKILEGENQCS